jgi:hypothetical protein
MILYAEPYIGALPVRFGMTTVEVAAAIGPPRLVEPGVFGTTNEARPGLMIGYSQADKTVYEVNCHAGVSLIYERDDLFGLLDPISFLRLFDPNPVLWVGFVIFLELGIQLSGFHDNDEPQRSISLIKRGTWADFIEDFKPFE